MKSNEGAARPASPHRSGVALILFTLVAVFGIVRLALVEGVPASLRTLFAEPTFVRWLGVSALLSVGLTVGLVLLALVAASSLPAGRRDGERVSSTGLAVQMFAGAMLSLPLYVTLTSLGRFDSRFALIIVSALSVLPFAIWQLKRGYNSVSSELYDIARIDGCSSAQSFRHVTFPAIRRPLMIAALFCFMTVWSLTVIARLIFPRLGGPEANYTDAPGALAAAALLAIVPPLLCFLALNLYAVPAPRSRADD